MNNNFSDMDRVNRIWRHPVYQEHYKKIQELESERIFCRHTPEHFLDVARLMYIYALEEHLELPKELIYRVNAILRRSYKGENPIVKLSGSEIDFDRAEVIKNGEHIALTAKEHDILVALYRNAGRIVTLDALCEAAWGDNPYGYENSLMAHIRRIREKIEINPSQPVSLITIKGLGYKLIVGDK